MKNSRCITRLIAVALISFALSISVFIPAFAEEGDGVIFIPGVLEEHTDHIRDDGTVIQVATCQQGGIVAYHCVVCGIDMGQETLPQLEHIMDSGTLVQPATCCQEGIIEYHCVACGIDMGVDRLPMLEHVSDAGVITVEPTVYNPGVITYSCVTCGKILKQDQIPCIQKRPKPTASVNTEYEILYNIPDNSTVKVNGIIVDPASYSDIYLGDYIHHAGQYSIEIVANAEEETAASDPQTIVLSCPQAPYGITALPIKYNGTPGAICGVDGSMEYIIEGSDEWKPCPNGKITVYEAAKYYVRYRATATSVVSDYTEVVVKSEVPKKPSVPNVTFDGPSHQLRGLFKGIAYSTNGGDNWNYIKNDNYCLELSMDQLNQAASYGVILVKDTYPIDSDILRLRCGKQGSPTNLSSTPSNGNDGKIKGVSNDMQFRIDGTNSWIDVGGNEIGGLAPGKFYVRRKANGYLFESSATEVEVKKAGESQGTKQGTPKAVFNAYNMLLSDIAGCRISFDGGKSYTDTMGVTAVTLSESQVNPNYGITIYRPGDGVNFKDSDRQYIPVTKLSVPTGITAVSATSSLPGYINGVDASMQYRLTNVPNWLDVPVGYSSVAVPAGTFYLRRHGYDNALASDALTVVIKVQEDAKPITPSSATKSASEVVPVDNTIPVRKAEADETVTETTLPEKAGNADSKNHLPADGGNNSDSSSQSNEKVEADSNSETGSSDSSENAVDTSKTELSVGEEATDENSSAGANNTESKNNSKINNSTDNEEASSSSIEVKRDDAVSAKADGSAVAGNANKTQETDDNTAKPANSETVESQKKLSKSAKNMIIVVSIIVLLSIVGIGVTLYLDNKRKNG